MKNRVFSYIAFILSILMTGSCSKNDTPVSPISRTLQVWLHRVNTIQKAQKYRQAYRGFELDVYYDSISGTFIVKHDETDTSTLTLPQLLTSIDNPPELGYWLDFKNLLPETGPSALEELLRIRQAFHLDRHTIVVESWNPQYLPPFDTLNFRPSFYIPYFDPSIITPEEEIYYRDYISGYITTYGIRTISAYYDEHSFMQKWFPEMNKLLWYLDSSDPAIKDSITKETAQDPTVEVLLVSETDVKDPLKAK